MRSLPCAAHLVLARDASNQVRTGSFAWITGTAADAPTGAPGVGRIRTDIGVEYRPTHYFDWAGGRVVVGRLRLGSLVPRRYRAVTTGSGFPAALPGHPPTVSQGPDRRPTVAAQVWVRPRVGKDAERRGVPELSPAASWTITSEPVVFDFDARSQAGSPSWRASTGRRLRRPRRQRARRPDAGERRSGHTAEGTSGEPRDGACTSTNDEGWEGFRYATVAAAPGRTVTISDPAAFDRTGAPSRSARLATADPELDAIGGPGSTRSGTTCGRPRERTAHRQG